MRRVAWIAVAFFLLPLTGALASSGNAEKLSGAIAAMKADDWQAAKRLIAQIQDDPARIYADWRRLRAGEGTWKEYVAFVKEHQDWPGLPLLRKVGETKIPDGRPHPEILSYFKDDLPQTGRGALRLSDALNQTGQKAAAENTIKLAWLTINLTEAERKAIHSRYAEILSTLHMKRADHLIWTGQFGQALALKGYLSSGEAKLVDTRVALRRNKNGVNKLIDALPDRLKKDPGLAYDRFRWRLRRDLWDSAGELLLAQSASREKLGRPEIWSDRRRMVARRLMRAGDYQAAYRVSSTHQLQSEEAGFIDLEWLSGYLKLVYLDDAEAAVTHFRRLRSSAVTPITSVGSGIGLGGHTKRMTIWKRPTRLTSLRRATKPAFMVKWRHSAPNTRPRHACQAIPYGLWRMRLSRTRPSFGQERFCNSRVSTTKLAGSLPILQRI